MITYDDAKTDLLYYSKADKLLGNRSELFLFFEKDYQGTRTCRGFRFHDNLWPIKETISKFDWNTQESPSNMNEATIEQLHYLIDLIFTKEII